ncbi:MAG: glycosyltransferase [Candidatus Sumerlaeota bacterium]|nr:glycosyltransferase [Candidatus Sumerlaeota bacterium]
MTNPTGHIAHVLSVSVYAGPSRTVVNLMAEDVRRGWRTTLALLERRGRPQERLRREAAAAGAEVVSIPLRGPFNPLALWRLRRLLKKREVDILHCHGYKPELYGLLANRGRRRRPIVATAHGFTGQSVRMHLYEALERRLLSRFDRVFAVSESLRRTLIGLGLSPKAVIHAPTGFDFRSFAPPEARIVEELHRRWAGYQRFPIVGTLGRLRHEKGQDLLLRALARLRSRAVGVLVGDGPARDALAAMAMRLPLEPPAILAGETDQPLATLAAFDVVAFPSRTEGMPNALIEAMALGKPIVAARVGGMAEAIADGESGLLVPPDEPAALAEAILRLLNDKTLAERLGRGARRRAESRYALETVGAELDAHYRILLARGRQE